MNLKKTRHSSLECCLTPDWTTVLLTCVYVTSSPRPFMFCFTSFRHKPIKRSSNYNPPLLICSRPSCAPEASQRFIAQNFREQPRSRARASSKLDISRVSPVMKTDMGCSTFSRRGFFGTVSSASQTNVYCS